MERDGPAAEAVATATERYGQPDVVASAPARVNLVGGHTDYTEGVVLPAAVDRRTAVAARGRDDRRVRVYSATVEEQAAFDLPPRPAGDPPAWSDYVAGVLAELGERDDPAGMDLAVASSVPVGAGLSSSAALELAVAAAAARVAGLDLAREDLARLCHAAETGFVGVDCGVMDQYAAAFGRADAALRLDCRSLSVDPVPVDADRAAVVAVDTTVSHDLAQSAYNDRVAECRRGVATLDARLDRELSSLRDVTAADLDAHGDALDDPVRSRVEHVVAENERVDRAATALAADDYGRVGELMVESHRSLREKYEVSCAELDAVVDVATGVAGVYGARMLGGGFGGSAVVLARPEAVERLAERVEDEYPERTGLDPDVYACDLADGVWVRDAGAEADAV